MDEGTRTRGTVHVGLGAHVKDMSWGRRERLERQGKVYERRAVHLLKVHDAQPLTATQMGAEVW